MANINDIVSIAEKWVEGLIAKGHTFIDAYVPHTKFPGSDHGIPLETAVALVRFDENFVQEYYITRGAGRVACRKRIVQQSHRGSLEEYFRQQRKGIQERIDFNSGIGLLRRIGYKAKSLL